jgi:ribonuclease R
VPPASSGKKAYDYAASGERYSLPKKPAVAAASPTLFGRAAKAIGRAFGRKELVVDAPVPAAHKAAASRDNPPSASRGSTRQRRDEPRAGAAGKSTGSSARRPRQNVVASKSAKPSSADATAAEPKKSSRRRSKPKPKGKS